MLALRLCGIPFDVILNEYMISAKCMAAWCCREELEQHLRTQPVLSVQKEYMTVAVEHLVKKYGDVHHYLVDCGVELDVLKAVRKNLMINPDEERLQVPLSEVGTSSSQ
jgi:hypothetical protein